MRRHGRLPPAAGLAVLCLLLALALLARRALPRGDVLALVGPTILHDGLECLPEGEYPRLEASIQPAPEIRTAKLYFRAEQHPDFYYVELSNTRDKFEAVLPKASPETRHVVYYVEALDRAFNATRTEEFVVPVSGDPACRRRRAALAFFPGNQPNIVVGATRGGAALIPPGFQAAGVSAFISFNGTVTVLGSPPAPGGSVTTSVASDKDKKPQKGSGSGKVVAIVAGVAAGAGLGYLGYDELKPTPTTSMSTTSTTTIFGQTTSSSSTTTSARSTTSTTTSTTTTSTILPLADLSVSKGESVDPATNGGRIPYTLTATNHGPNVATRVTLTDTLPPSLTFQSASAGCGVSGRVVTCSLGNLKPNETRSLTLNVRADVSPNCVNLKAPDCGAGVPAVCCVTNSVQISGGQNDPNPSNNEDAERTTVSSYLITLEPLQPETAFASYLGMGRTDRSVGGQVLLNGLQLDATDSSGPFRHSLRGQSGANTLEAYVNPDSPEGTLWQFDFSGARYFVPGSLKVESGEVVSLSATSVLFRLSRSHGARIKLGFELCPR